MFSNYAFLFLGTGVVLAIHSSSQPPQQRKTGIVHLLCIGTHLFLTWLIKAAHEGGSYLSPNN